MILDLNIWSKEKNCHKKSGRRELQTRRLQRKNTTTKEKKKKKTTLQKLKCKYQKFWIH